MERDGYKKWTRGEVVAGTLIDLVRRLVIASIQWIPSYYDHNRDALQKGEKKNEIQDSDC